MKKMLKILPILMTVLMVLTAVSPVLASTTTPFDKINVSEGVNKANQGSTNFWNIGNQILGIIQIFGTIIAIGVLMVLGIKYMMGSAEEKAEYKKTMLPYVIGAVVLFSAVNIAKAVVSLIPTT